MSGFTENQRKAIDLRGNVLVLAGAGTGKTRTLVQRCVEWLLKPGAENSLDQLLMVTFTDAAAAEMRQRIREELTRRTQSHGLHTHLHEQLALLDSASISTLHSFCFRLVRQHFYELDLDPQLSILPEEEARLLAHETLSTLFEKHYAQDTDQARAVQWLIQVQARGWDVPVHRLVLRLHHYRQTLPDPDEWLNGQRALFAQPEPGHWHQWLAEAIDGWRHQWLAVLRSLGSDNPNLGACMVALESFPTTPSLAQIHDLLGQISAADNQPWPRGSKAKIRDGIKDLFEEAEFLHGLTGPAVPLSREGQDSELDPTQLGRERSGVAEQALDQDWAWVRGQMTTLLDVTLEFGRAFAQAKRELGAVDFHDLEQFSLRLLYDPQTRRPTALAHAWRQKLQLIFVDEYQDINAAQDAILRALAREGRLANRFLVGDPKQSIYRFRLADPHIFHQYTAQWQRCPDQGQVVPLTDNFRSRQSILDVVNAIFSVVMKRELGGVEYDESAWLRCGIAGQSGGTQKRASDQPTGLGSSSPAMVAPVEFHLRLVDRHDESQSGGEGDAEDAVVPFLNTTEAEARLVGQRLAALRADQRQIWDARTQSIRPVDWNDMVVLLRSPQRKVEAYAKEFSQLGIPLTATRGGFFESPEVMDLLNLLTLLDNPLQDVPLLAVLRSPFVALNLDELAVLRLAGKGRFWTALQFFHRHWLNGRNAALDSPQDRLAPAGKLQAALADPTVRPLAEALWPKVDRFCQQFARWRRWVRQTSLSESLDRILSETEYLAFLLPAARGEQQRGNVLKLLTWARHFDQFHRQGLYRFLRFVQAQKEAQIDREPAPLATGNAVRLMSIHQSKGLEFGVVVVADLGKPFNLVDLRASVILDERFGLCPLIKPPMSEQRYPSLPHWLAQRRQKEEILGEEMRLLYVAMTRACQCLILAGSVSRSAAEGWSQRPYPPVRRDLLAARGYLDWLGPWLNHVVGKSEWLHQGQGTCGLFEWTISSADESCRLEAVGPLAEVSGQPPPVSALDRHSADTILRKLAWSYPAALATHQAAKLSVSKLRLSMVAQTGDEPELYRGRQTKVASISANTPLSSANVGTAHHTFLQFVHLDQVGSIARLRAEANRIQQDGKLSRAECQALDLAAIAGFWKSKIGRQLLECKEFVHREMAFTAKLSLEEVKAFQAGPAANPSEARTDGASSASAELVRSGDFVILTGVVDLFVLLPNEIWLLDFKTDAADPESWADTAQIYEPQMHLYALALGRVYSRPVTRCWLHGLAVRRTIEVKLPEIPGVVSEIGCKTAG